MSRSHGWRSAAGVTAVCGLGLVTGCGSSTTSALNQAQTALNQAQGAANASAGKHACDVFTLPIAKQTVGSDAHLTRKYQPNPHMTQCQYQGSKGSANVEVGGWGAIKLLGSTPGGTPVPGLGDEATISPLGLVVKKGDRGMDIDYTSGGTATYVGSAANSEEQRNRDGAKKLARALLPGL